MNSEERRQVAIALEELKDRNLNYVTAGKVALFSPLEVRHAGRLLSELEDAGLLEEWGTSTPQTYKINQIPERNRSLR